MSATFEIDVFSRLLSDTGMPEFTLKRILRSLTVDQVIPGGMVVSSSAGPLTVPATAVTGLAITDYFIYCQLVSGQASATGSVSWIDGNGAAIVSSRFGVTSAKPYVKIESGLNVAGVSAELRVAQIRVAWISGGSFNATIGVAGDV